MCVYDIYTHIYMDFEHLISKNPQQSDNRRWAIFRPVDQIITPVSSFIYSSTDDYYTFIYSDRYLLCMLYFLFSSSDSCSRIPYGNTCPICLLFGRFL